MRMVLSSWWNSKTHPHASICLQTDKELHKYTEELLVDLSWINRPLSPFDIICQLETTNLCCLVDNLLGKMMTIYEITRLIKYSTNCLSPLAIHLVEMKTKTTQHEILWPLGEILISLCFAGLFSTLSHECSVILLLVNVLIGAFWQQATSSAEVMRSVNYACLLQKNGACAGRLHWEVCFRGCYLNWTVSFFFLSFSEPGGKTSRISKQLNEISVW